MESNDDSKNNGTTVTCNIDATANQLLTRSAKQSKRSKKCESELRLEDHLRKFSSISAIGITENRE
ncbi:TraY domain-containing protein [Candidatus Fukatsuia symbiotica]|uniref:TraY domain-containing protein n=1 Tax=Candidatus Fukatsuia symbiotica TaxID=1878942 RepID=UPI001C1F2110|nr:TraY domain-containing protein [Candidatus Fukatsuia symbiotica]